MTLSEFWDAVDDVFGATLGRSLTADLYLPSLRGSCAEALDRGVSPAVRWVHRLDAKEREKIRRSKRS